MHKIHTFIISLFCLATVSCSDLEFIIPESDEGKEMISFSVSSDEALATRAGFHGGDTFIAMRMQSNSKKGGAALYTKTTATAGVDATNSTASYSSVNFTESEKRYWDDAHGQYSLLSVYAVAIPNAVDDVAQLKSKLADGGTGGLSATWGNNDKNTIDWTVSKEQTKDATDNNPVTASSSTIDKEDLVYSNNIQKNGKDGVYRWDFTTNKYVPDATGAANHKDGQMTFITQDNQDNPLNTPSSTSGKFDKGHLIFKHALSRITVTLESGDGFDGAPFTLDASGVQFLTMNVKGTLNLPTGVWTHDATAPTGNITTKPSKQTESEPAPKVYYKTVAQMLPGYSFVDGSSTKVMQFTIDGNTYYITQDMLFDALNKSANQFTDYGYDGTARKFTMMQGKNYQFKFRVNKRQVEVLTATLVDWQSVEAEQINPSNAYVKVQVKTNEGSEVTGAPTFDLYRAEGDKYTGPATVEAYNNHADYNWEKGYVKSDDLAEKTGSPGIYTTDWYWPDNQTFYHFRTISPQDETIYDNEATTYIAVSGGVIKDGSVTAKDYIWGAPFKESSPDPDVYSFETGYCNNDAKSNGQLYKAIGSTEDKITLIQHHMTSQVFVDLETTSGSDAVNLDGATVQLVNIAQNAQLYVGNGLVTGHDSFGNVTMTADAHDAASPIPAYDYSYGVLPQKLSANGNGTGKVGLTITAADGNVYLIDDLSQVKEESTSTAIDQWLPGRKYYYKFTLKKTGIVNLQATVVNWESVTADNETVTIK